MKILSIVKIFLAYAIFFGIIYISSYGLYSAYDNVGTKEKNYNITSNTFKDNTKVSASVLKISPYTLKDTPAQQTTKSNIYGFDTQATNSNDSKILVKLFENLDKTQNNHITVNSEGKKNGEKNEDINVRFYAANLNGYNIYNRSVISELNTDKKKGLIQRLNPKNENGSLKTENNTKNLQVVIKPTHEESGTKIKMNPCIKTMFASGVVDILFKINSPYQLGKKEIDKNKIQTNVFKYDPVHKNNQLDKININSVDQNVGFTDNYLVQNQIQLQDTSKTAETTTSYKETSDPYTVTPINEVNYTNYINTALNIQDCSPICYIDNKYIRCKNLTDKTKENIDLDILTICNKKLGKMVNTNDCTNKTNIVINKKYPPCSKFMCNNDKIVYDLYNSIRLNNLIFHNNLQEYDYKGIQKHGHLTNTIYVKTIKTHAFGVNIKDCDHINPKNMPLEYLNTLSLHKHIRVQTFDQLLPLFSASYKSALFVYQEDYYSYLAFYKDLKGDDGFSIILTDLQIK